MSAPIPEPINRRLEGSGTPVEVPPPKTVPVDVVDSVNVKILSVLGGSVMVMKFPALNRSSGIRPPGTSNCSPAAMQNPVAVPGLGQGGFPTIYPLYHAHLS